MGLGWEWELEGAWVVEVQEVQEAEAGTADVDGGVTMRTCSLPDSLASRSLSRYRERISPADFAEANLMRHIPATQLSVTYGVASGLLHRVPITKNSKGWSTTRLQELFSRSVGEGGEGGCYRGVL